MERAARVLRHLPDTITEDLDPVLLATHPHVNVRQLSATMCVRQPQRYATTLNALAADKSFRVRFVLADAAARQHAMNDTAVADLLAKLSADRRFKVRQTAQASRYVRPRG
ncbi:hypothetical protein AB0C12_06330 [Actinoplanes sp. NPDC048967]|uniref:hypothetical protein n=1 Tax=Actinoplanes sp. NPDC048967 TaxID=3155269 RepID=UPI003411AE3F